MRGQAAACPLWPVSGGGYTAELTSVSVKVLVSSCNDAGRGRGIEREAKAQVCLVHSIDRGYQVDV